MSSQDWVSLNPEHLVSHASVFSNYCKSGWYQRTKGRRGYIKCLMVLNVADGPRSEVEAYRSKYDRRVEICVSLHHVQKLYGVYEEDIER